MKKTLFVLSLLAVATTLTAQDVTLGTLLDEMVDRERLTRFPSPSFTSSMFSSYDRRSVTKDKPEWFANDDYSHFVRVEENNGRRELVMLDAKGPGAVLTVPFFAEETGKRRVTATVTKAADYAIVDMGINGEWSVKDFDGFLQHGIQTQAVDLGIVELKKGENIFNVKIIGANEQMPTIRYIFGLDCIDLKKL